MAIPATLFIHYIHVNTGKEHLKLPRCQQDIHIRKLISHTTSPSKVYTQPSKAKSEYGPKQPRQRHPVRQLHNVSNPLYQEHSLLTLFSRASEYPINDSPSKPIEPSHFSHSPDKLRGHKSYVETQIPNPSPVSAVKQVYETAILENVGF